jgi:tetratricopeptide (TPR) repeat protein
MRYNSDIRLKVNEDNMGRDDWFRNTVWSADIAANFYQRLKRARQKGQYLRIQATYLTKNFPEVALQLLEQYFSLGTDFDKALALITKGEAHITLGDTSAAISAYGDAVERQIEYHNVKTDAPTTYACLVANEYIEALYERALDIVDTPNTYSIFPLHNYLANGARALILHELGKADEAHQAALLAMDAARVKNSGLRYHGALGLVENSDDIFGKRIRALAQGIQQNRSIQ